MRDSPFVSRRHRREYRVLPSSPPLGSPRHAGRICLPHSSPHRVYIENPPFEVPRGPCHMNASPESLMYEHGATRTPEGAHPR
jgi:hypothetical protein